MSFNNKVVLVTGASSGIGAAIAIKFAAEAAYVAIVGRNEQKLKNVSEECEKVGSKPLVIVADVTKDNDAKRIVDETVQKFQKIDVLVNNAGIGGRASITAEQAISMFDKVMATNLRSVVHLTHLASKHLIGAKGNIINISSVASKMCGSTESFAYCTSKAALDHFTRAIASELASKGVRANTVNPGPVKTDIIENMGASSQHETIIWDLMKNATALKRISEPEEVAEVVLFLASDKAIAITGASFVTDNGVSVPITIGGLCLFLSTKYHAICKMSFNSKVVLVTGASSGIGAAIALKFATELAQVVIVGRNEKKLKDVAEKCEKAGSKPLIIIADISKDNDAKRVIDKTVQKFQKIDVLVNNAGVGGRAGITADHAMHTFDQVMSTNLRAVVYLTHLASKHIIEAKGNIVNISSIAARMITSKQSFSYCTSKAALDHFTRAIASELASKGVRVNTVNPGPVKTDILENQGGTEEQQAFMWDAMKKATALKRISDPQEIAELVLFLASDKAIAITGSSFVTDNGVLVNSSL